MATNQDNDTMAIVARNLRMLAAQSDDPDAKQQIEKFASEVDAADDGGGVNGRFLDICDRLNDKIRWSHGMLSTLATDPDMGGPMSGTIAGVAAHIYDARNILQELDAVRKEIAGGAS